MITVPEFLSLIFAKAGSGYVNVITVPETTTGNSEESWQNLRSMFYAVNDGVTGVRIDPESTDSWYFCPTLFTNKARRQESVHLSSVLWVDCDTPGINPYDFKPHPSIVVTSSPGKYHCYWLLDEPLSVSNLEHWNKRLAYGLLADHSGWDAVQLLRLPVGYNDKYGVRKFQVGAVFCDPDLVYTLDDFAKLPEVLDIQTIVFNDPLPTEPIAVDYLFELYAESMSVTLKNLLTRKARDRSRTLWRIYHICHKLNIPKTHCFWLVLASPNNKFAQQRWDSHASLWRDICAGYEQASRSVLGSGILDTMQTIRRDKDLPHGDRLDRLGRLLVDDMNRFGTFCRGAMQSDFFYLTENGDLISTERRSPALRRLLLDTYGVNAGTREYDALHEHIFARCQDEEPHPIKRFSTYSRDTNVLYINRYDSKLYRLDGEHIELVPNGTDDVIFQSPLLVQAYERRSPMTGGLFDKLVLGCANVATQRGTTPEEIRFILRAWVYALFFPELFAAKPILLLHGETGDQPLTAMVWTPGGPKRMGDIKVDDQVCSPDGSITNVIQLHPQGVQKVFRVRTSDGRETRVGERHLWLTKTAGQSANGPGPWRIRTTQYVKQLIDSGTRVLIPHNSGLALTRYTTRWSKKVDPYTLGLLLGDGTMTQRGGVELGMGDIEPIQYVADLYQRAITYDDSNCALVTLPVRTGVPDALAALGLIGTRSRTKFVPQSYQLADEATRLAVVQGLLDTDGTVDKEGSISFGSRSKQLAADLTWLLRSLGVKVHQSMEMVSKNVTSELEPFYELHVNDPQGGSRLFRLPRKRQRCVEGDPGRAGDVCAIVSIEFVGEELTQCITVDNPNGLYLTDDLIVTHNSGKTAVFKSIASVLLRPGREPHGLPKDSNQFDEIVGGNDFVFIDNIDEQHNWLQDPLARVATSYAIEKRKLYTDSQMVRREVSCFVGLTSRTPKFVRDDIAERLIPVRVEPFAQALVNESTIARRIADARNELWGEILEDLSDIVAYIGVHGLPSFAGDFRQGDFAAFLSVMVALSGGKYELKRLVDFIRREQVREAIEGDPLAHLLQQWLDTPTNQGRELTPEALFVALSSLAGGGDFFRNRITTPRGLTIALSRATRYLEPAGITYTKTDTTPIKYSFSRQN